MGNFQWAQEVRFGLLLQESSSSSSSGVAASLVSTAPLPADELTRGIESPASLVSTEPPPADELARDVESFIEEFGD